MSALDALAQDLRHAARALRHQPTYALIVVLTLGLGIAGNSVIFSVMNPYLLRALPFDEPDELVQLGHVDPATGWDGARMSLAMVRDYEEESTAFAELGAYTYGTRNLADEGGVPVRKGVAELSGDLFGVLGVEAALGRTFGPDEAGPAGADVVVLDDGFWRERYGGDPDVLGRSIRLDGVPHTVVGVMPPEFVFPWNEIKLFAPIRGGASSEAREDAWYMPVGRLADGWSRERAREELTAIQGRLAEAHPQVDGEYEGVSVTPLRAALNFAWEPLSVGFPILLGAVAFVLLIVCVNVASLTLARASARQREVAVRAAIGAGRRRIVRQLLTESGVLAVAGGLLGLGLAWAAVSVLGPLVPESLYRVGDVTLDGTVLAYTAAVTLVTPLLFGLAPALTASRTDLADTLRSGGSGSGQGRERLRGRRALVVAEVALGIVLVAGAGLMLRSFGEVQRVDLGFEPERILAVVTSPPENAYSSQDAVEAYYDEAAAEVEALPGVQEVGEVGALPMNHETFVRQFAVPGSEPPTARDWPRAYYTRVSPDYFEAMGVELRAGRAFRPGDGASDDDPVIVSESLARRHFGGENPLGRALAVGDPEDPSTATVVGVAAEVQQADLVYEDRPQLYRPIDGAGYRRRFLVLRTAGDPAALVRPVREALLDLDPDLPVTIRPMSEIVGENTFVWSVGSATLGAFGAFAVFLAALGIYGVVAYSVQRRRRELGIRMALGATADGIRRLVVSDGLKLAAIGVTAGLVLSLLAGRLMSSILFGVSPVDPMALGGTLVLFLGVAAASSLVPALRASRAQPGRVLREE